ncbi:MAG: DUF1684 domain-containing protein [Cyclobacteriaceae bacterium]|nr:DUF1684 domain-containing protein [Cyclobacteriaceae bacterium]
MPPDPVYVKEIDAWHVYRVEVLKSPTGWLNLAGLFWLKEGINSFGAAADNDLVFPPVAEVQNYGYFLLDKGMVKQVLMPGVLVTNSGKRVAETQVVFHPDSARQPVMESGSLRWFVIKRDTKYGVRLRDLNHPNLFSFAGIERYPVDAAWKVTARWEETPGRTISITNVLGQTTPQSAPGTLVFSLNGREYRLDALDEGDPDRLFVIFGDATNTRETYGAGRYLYVPKPDSLGEVPLDFNKAENPPCAFTEFATCPLPPIQNVMDTEVRAGEKDYKHH